MAKIFDEINPEFETFIKNQKIFFVGTAATEGRVNISPKGMDTFRVLGPNKVVWLNLTGSGNETAAHVLKNNRMTILFCSFEGKPLILRLYGQAKIHHQRDESYHEYIDLFPKILGSRQIIEMNVDTVQTSCGYAVPFMDFKEERTQLKSWAEKQGEDRLKEYHKERNKVSIDNFKTGI
ncbi:pyridoxamine 5'-phosphate oxidase family protein [Aquimarina algiphila]|uniref:Pyridoxamine 5'-phosphate oxidase family protein n=1 Tax=Aquimarina algiphila TaxID=2047982 RepID=A0A554VK04_9FLAO|nr:pyridoxamine 5'-phosphate oxidase family protein [Aquimarina algiphila]TSE08294.1 pyridoxamine 5'-phosphate oxidase family protein [Aquimarina algiphila]